MSDENQMSFSPSANGGKTSVRADGSVEWAGDADLSEYAATTQGHRGCGARVRIFPSGRVDVHMIGWAGEAVDPVEGEAARALAAAMRWFADAWLEEMAKRKEEGGAA